MSRTLPTFQLEEISGDRYPDLHAAQRLAANELVDGLPASEGGQVVLNTGKEFANA